MAMERSAAAEAVAETAGDPVEALVLELRDYLVQISEDKALLAELDPDGDLLDHGYLDSLSAVMFIAHVQERYGVRIEDMELMGELNTLRAVAAHVDARR